MISGCCWCWICLSCWWSIISWTCSASKFVSKKLRLNCLWWFGRLISQIIPWGIFTGLLKVIINISRIWLGNWGIIRLRNYRWSTIIFYLRICRGCNLVIISTTLIYCWGDSCGCGNWGSFSIWSWNIVSRYALILICLRLGSLTCSELRLLRNRCLDRRLDWWLNASLRS